MNFIKLFIHNRVFGYIDRFYPRVFQVIYIYIYIYKYMYICINKQTKLPNNVKLQFQVRCMIFFFFIIRITKFYNNFNWTEYFSPLELISILFFRCTFNEIVELVCETNKILEANYARSEQPVKFHRVLHEVHPKTFSRRILWVPR